MTIKKFHVYLADLNPRIGTEAGKVRPVVVVQTDLLNNHHPSTIVCPLTTQVNPQAHLLRVHVRRGQAGTLQDSDILLDQMRAIDNRRFLRQLGHLPTAQQRQLLDNLRLILD